jgi:hypothetical protein
LRNLVDVHPKEQLAGDSTQLLEQMWSRNYLLVDLEYMTTFVEFLCSIEVEDCREVESPKRYK